MSQLNGEHDRQRSAHDDLDRAGVQAHVNRHFDSTASYWDGVYRGADLQGVIYQQRQAAVLDYVDGAGLPSGARALEIGCGAGHLTVRLAERGLRVEAIDASEAMVAATAGRAREAGLHERIDAQLADVHALPCASASFDLVVAVGVIPWLHSPGDAVAEIARVLRPSGQLVLTADNRARLVSFTDPRAILALSPLKRVYDWSRKRRGVATSRLHYPHRVDRLLEQHSLRPVQRKTVGFGPLSLLGRPIAGDARGVRVHRRLQALADRGTPGVRWTGWHYVVRAEKDSPHPVPPGAVAAPTSSRPAP
jgi:ubiquinone/menaquinone biosynthesis C-methylase UbiE